MSFVVPEVRDAFHLFLMIVFGLVYVEKADETLLPQIAVVTDSYDKGDSVAIYYLLL